MKRWRCPQCNKGVNAPARMLLDDVRRYCLDCSVETGRLVKRLAVAIESAEGPAKRRRLDSPPFDPNA